MVEKNFFWINLKKIYPINNMGKKFVKKIPKKRKKIMPIGEYCKDQEPKEKIQNLHV